MNYEIIVGDCLQTLKTLPEKSIRTCVTSPPYHNLRDYGTGTWVGGDPACNHFRDSKLGETCTTGHQNSNDFLGVGDAIYKSVCAKCGAVREDLQIGLETTPDEYVEKLVNVFREVRRVLTDDGTVWLNLGDTYVGTGDKGEHKDPKYAEGRNAQAVALNRKVPGLKSKDLIGIPWRVAFALQADGWYLRQDIIWHKPNPMPESVQDRCTKAHEYIFLLSKNGKYFFDPEAMKEPATSIGEHLRRKVLVESHGDSEESTKGMNGGHQVLGGLAEFKNKRSVWTVPTRSYAGAHFATYPVDLITPCVLAGSAVGDTVLDPFNGSGTTGLVATHYGRKYIGLELNPEYADLARGRIDAGLENAYKVPKEPIQSDIMQDNLFD